MTREKMFVTLTAWDMVRDLELMTGISFPYNEPQLYKCGFAEKNKIIQRNQDHTHLKELATQTNCPISRETEQSLRGIMRCRRDTRKPDSLRVILENVTRV